MREQLAQTDARASQALHTVVPTSSQPRPRMRLPDPPKFDGKQHRHRIWQPQMKAKLEVDGEAIGNDMAKFFYTYDRLEPTVQAMVLPQLAVAEAQKSWDYNTILQQLARVYDNPNEVFEAEEAIYTIKQEDQPLSAYIAKFERLLFEAQGQNWPDTNKIITFRAGLSPALRKGLSLQLAPPSDYPGFLSLVQHLNRRLYAPSAAPTSSAPYHNPDKMDVSVGAVNINTARARSTSPAYRQALRRKGCCVRCGSDFY